MYSAKQRWSVEHEKYGEIKIREIWCSKDKLAKLLGMFASNRLYTDWKVAKLEKNVQKNPGRNTFIDVMKNCYKPKENPTLTNFHFRAITQSSEETYPDSKKKPSTVTLNATMKTVQPIVVRDQL